MYRYVGEIAKGFPVPEAIVCVPAHWYTDGTFVSSAPTPKTIHDFTGFPQALYQLQYPAPGALELAVQVAAQKPVFVWGTVTPAIWVGQDGYLGNLIGYPTMPDQCSVGFIPREDYFISRPQRGAMFRLTRHKAAAGLFLAYLTGYEHQSARGTWSVREDVEPPKGLSAIESYANTGPMAFIR